jgi:hypothetical protein
MQWIMQATQCTAFHAQKARRMLRVHVSSFERKPSGKRSERPDARRSESLLALALVNGKSWAYVAVSEGDVPDYRDVVLDGMEGDSLFGSLTLCAELWQRGSRIAVGRSEAALLPYESESVSISLANDSEPSTPCAEVHASVEALAAPTPEIDLCVEEVRETPNGSYPDTFASVHCNGQPLGTAESLPLTLCRAKLGSNSAVEVALDSTTVLSRSLESLSPLRFVLLSSPQARCWARLLTLPPYPTATTELERVDVQVSINKRILEKIRHKGAERLRIFAYAQNSSSAKHTREVVAEELLPLSLFVHRSDTVNAMLYVKKNQYLSGLQLALESIGVSAHNEVGRAQTTPQQIGSEGTWGDWATCTMYGLANKYVGYTQIRATRLRRVGTAPAVISSDRSIASPRIQDVAGAVMNLQHAIAEAHPWSLEAAHRSPSGARNKKEDAAEICGNSDEHAGRVGNHDAAQDEHIPAEKQDWQRRERLLEDEVRKLSEAPLRVEQASKRFEELRSANQMLQRKHEKVSHQASKAAMYSKQARELHKKIRQCYQQLHAYGGTEM